MSEEGSSGDVGAGIAIDALGVRYVGRRESALDEVTTNVARGELLAVAGRTGAGKSTLTLAAAGFIPRVVRAKVRGDVRIDGRSIIGTPAAEVVGRVGIVFATPANQLSASKLTVREELAFGLENLAVPRAEMDARIDAVLARLGIEHLADREPFALSGGEQQRVAIASIVAMGTRVLVLDEPTAQLDPSGTASVADLLLELAGSGSSVICAEHDPVVLGRARRCLVLDAGRGVIEAEPGIALGRASLAPLGLTVPTIVRLAEAAAVAPAARFDEVAVSEALAAAAAGDRLAVHDTDAASDESPVWQPAEARDAVDITIEGLVHRYPNGVVAVKDVDLRIGAGEAVAIVGQNGSGKTTLIKHLNGLLRPTSGRIVVGGMDTAGEPLHRLAATVGFVFQNPDDQLFERSVEREVRFGPRNLGLSGKDMAERVERALEAVGLVAERATNPYDLGISLRKLVAMAGVLAMDPLVLVLDEPTTGQDAPGVAHIGAIIDAFRRSGRTVIAITHDMEFAARHFDRIAAMRAGSIVADGPPRAVFGGGGKGVLASTGLTAPPAARIAARLGLDGPLTAEELLADIVSRSA